MSIQNPNLYYTASKPSNRVNDYSNTTNQKYSQNTVKHQHTYFNQRNRRFNRKHSTQNSNRSIDLSRRSSKQLIPDNHYIKTPRGVTKLTGVFQGNDFFTQLANKLKEKQCQSVFRIRQKNQEQGGLLNFTPEKRTHKKVSKENYIAKIESLQVQKQIHQKQIQVLRQKHEKLDKFLQQQKQRRRAFQIQKKQLAKIYQKLKKDYQKIQKEKKILIAEKQTMQKQIEFMEKINYNENTRTLQSYRQKYLETQLLSLREQMKKSRSARQKKLQQQISRLNQQVYTQQSHLKSLRISNECLLKQLAQNSDDIREIVLNSEQYIKLRQKYKSFLDDYKKLRTQYASLRNQATANMKNDSSLMSMTFSEADQSRDHNSNNY